MASRLTGHFRLPAAVIRHAAPLPGHERVSQLGRILTGHDLPLRTRVAAAIVLLYAQPLSRIVRLTLDDVIHDGDQDLLRIGEPPTPVPGLVADPLLSWIGNRDNMNTATNRNSPWLFGVPVRSVSPAPNGGQAKYARKGQWAGRSGGCLLSSTVRGRLVAVR